MNAITGGKHKPQNQSPLVGLASSLLGGQHGAQTSHSGSGSGGIGGIAGQLVGSFLDGGGKPQQQQQQQQPSSNSSGGGFMSFLGGHHGSSVDLANSCLYCYVLIDIAESEQHLWILFRWAKLKQRWLLSASSTGIISGARPAWICECTTSATGTTTTASGLE